MGEWLWMWVGGCRCGRVGEWVSGCGCGWVVVDVGGWVSG